MKQEALSQHTANRARHWTFIQREKQEKTTTTTDDYKQVKTMKHPKKRQVMRKQTRFSIYLTTLIPILIFLLSNINCGCSYMAEWDPKKKKNQL